MLSKQEADNLREAVAVFDSSETFQEAIDELLSSGFDRAELSLLASEHAVEEKLGHRYKKVAKFEDDPAVPRKAYVSTESIGDAQGGLIGGLVYVGAIAAAGAIVATGGTLAAIITGVAVAGSAGGLIGSMLAVWVGEHHAHYLEEQLIHGGLLLWVRTTDEERERRATEILAKHSGKDVHVHGLSAAA